VELLELEVSGMAAHRNLANRLPLERMSQAAHILTNHF
jgi:hypothetical protein